MNNPDWRLVAVFFLAGLTLLVGVSVFSAVAAANTVPESRADALERAVDGNDIKPEACLDINIQHVIDIGAGDTPTAENDLILGTSGNDGVIRGGDGDDCILGGGGNDGRRFLFFFFPGLYGDAGDDVVLGGPGTDACTGGGGVNTLIGCEWEW